MRMTIRHMIPLMASFLFAIKAGYALELGSLAKVDSMLEMLFPATEPGAAVLIGHERKVVWDKGYGVADIHSRIPITGNTFFNIASVSKAFTAMAVLQLAEQGRLSLEDPVAYYRPDFQSTLWRHVRIKHLLAHSSGVPDARHGLTREQRVYGDEALAMEYMKSLDTLHFLPGTQYEYINPTFVLLGDIVERVTGLSFERYMKKHILRPAGMKHTCYFDRHHQERIKNMAHGYEYGSLEGMGEEHAAHMPQQVKDWYEYDYGEETFFATRPDGGMYSSTHEFLRWIQALDAYELLGKYYQDMAQQPHTKVTGSIFSDYQNRGNTWYGWGWFVETSSLCHPHIVYHTGDNGGFKILAALLPETHSFILIFANRTDWDRYEVLQKIIRILQLNS